MKNSRCTPYQVAFRPRQPAEGTRVAESVAICPLAIGVLFSRGVWELQSAVFDMGRDSNPACRFGILPGTAGRKRTTAGAPARQGLPEPHSKRNTHYQCRE